MKNLICLGLVTILLGSAVGATAQIPRLINYQGQVHVNGTIFNGTGSFKFAMVNGDGTQTYWSNDGTSAAGAEPSSAVSLPVVDGRYSVLLGDDTISNMTELPASVFSNNNVQLRIWFDDGTNGSEQLSPDQRIGAVALAFVAESVTDGAVGSPQLANDLTLGGTTVLGNGLDIPSTTGPEVGVITVNGNKLIHTFGNENFYAGQNAGSFLNTGFHNTGLGFNTLPNNTSGIRNTAVGSNALTENTEGEANTAIGVAALEKNATGSFNTAAGSFALHSNTTGGWNSAVGDAALVSNTEGHSNSATGTGALFSNTTGNGNSAYGRDALFSNITGNENTAIGLESLKSASTADDNTAVGVRALTANTSGFNNTAIGVNSLLSNTTGAYNVANGTRALESNTTGSNNVGIGEYTLGSNTEGQGNTGMGKSALVSNTIGIFNTATGYLALRYNTTGNRNSAFGHDSLRSNTTGVFNTALGGSSLPNNTTGNENIAIGLSAGENLTTGDSNIMIGNVGTEGESGAIRLGDSEDHSKTFIAGIRGTTTGVADGIPVLIDSEGQLGTISSSRRYKEDIKPMAETSERLHDLNPVTFRYKKPFADGDQPLQFGLIAEEVATTFPELVVHDETGRPDTVKYQDLPPLLLNEVQKLKAENDLLRKELAQQKADNEKQAERLATIEATLSSGRK